MGRALERWRGALFTGEEQSSRATALRKPCDFGQAWRTLTIGFRSSAGIADTSWEKCKFRFREGRCALC